jgi:hypothetical protein
MAIKGRKTKRVKRVRKAPPDTVAELTADEIANIVSTLECTINALKSADCPPGCDQINSLIEMYEWALEEFKQARDGGKPDRAKRIAELCGVLGLGPEWIHGWRD